MVKPASLWIDVRVDFDKESFARLRDMREELFGKEIDTDART